MKNKRIKTVIIILILVIILLGIIGFVKRTFFSEKMNNYKLEKLTYAVPSEFKQKSGNKKVYQSYIALNKKFTHYCTFTVETRQFSDDRSAKTYLVNSLIKPNEREKFIVNKRTINGSEWDMAYDNKGNYYYVIEKGGLYYLVEYFVLSDTDNTCKESYEKIIKTIKFE